MGHILGDFDFLFFSRVVQETCHNLFLSGGNLFFCSGISRLGAVLCSCGVQVGFSESNNVQCVVFCI